MEGKAKKGKGLGGAGKEGVKREEIFSFTLSCGPSQTLSLADIIQGVESHYSLISIRTKGWRHGTEVMALVSYTATLIPFWHSILFPQHSK